MSAHRTMRRRPRAPSDCQHCGAPETATVCPWTLVCPVCAAAPHERCTRPDRSDCSMHRARFHAAAALTPASIRDPIPGEEGQFTLL